MIGLDEMLARTAEFAQQWPLELDERITGEDDSRGPGLRQAHLVCTHCGQSVYCLSKNLAAGVGVFNLAQLGPAVTRHLREAHCDGGGSPV